MHSATFQKVGRVSHTAPLQRPVSVRARTARVLAVAPRSELDNGPDNANILVAGGGGVAFETTKLLKNMGSWVWMLQRTDVRKKEIEKMFAVWVKGDALNKDDVDKAFKQIEGLDAVVTTIGRAPGETANADSEGNINLIEAAAKYGVKKIILVTSIGAGESKAGTPPNVYEALKPVLVEKEKAEAKLKEVAAAKGIDFVIIRPGGLQTAPATGNGVLTEDPSVCGAITRADVAKLIAKALFTDKSNGKTLSAVDKNQVFDNKTFATLDI